MRQKGQRAGAESEEADIYPLKTMFLVAWRDCVLQEKFPLFDVAFDMVTRDRNGEKFNISLVRGLVRCFVELGSAEKDDQKLQIYKKHFEHAFLDETEAYYRQEAQDFLALNGIPTYLEHVNTRLNQERHRCEVDAGSIDPSTLNALMQRMFQVLIVEHVTKIVVEIPQLLTDGKVGSLMLAYQLLKHIDPALGIEPFKDVFQEHIVKAGRIQIDKTIHGDKTDPKAYVESILQCHATYTKIIEEAFDRDVAFTARLDKAAHIFINNNRATEAAATRGKGKREGTNQAAQESSRLLAKFCDEVFRDKKTDAEIIRSTLVGGATKLFLYLECEDVFNNYYQKDFSHRLLSGKANHEAERDVISSLKGKCGRDFARKLQEMFKDMQISKELDKEYGKKASKPKEACVSGAMVLTRAHWPSVKLGKPLKLPSAMQASLDHFKSFYTSKHAMKKLNWVMAKSRGELETVGLRGQHKIQCSAHQMAILCLFNRKTAELSIGEIITALDAGESVFYIHAVLETLVSKYKLLEGGPKKTKVADMPADTVLKLNKKWKIKSKRLDINISLKVKGVSAETLEQAETFAEIQRAREVTIQCTIVKQMKSLAGKSMKHTALEGAVVSMLKFNPDTRMLKKQIQWLIEEQYMDRVEGDTSSYIYIP